MKEISMLSLQERVILLKEELSKVSAEELYNELQSYEAVGPLACDFLSDESDTLSHKYWKHSFNSFQAHYNNIHDEITVLEVTYVKDERSSFISACNDDDYNNCLAA